MPAPYRTPKADRLAEVIDRELDLKRANARIRRAAAIDELQREHTMLSRGEAAQLVDAGGPVCSRCGERVPRAEVAAHVAAHAEGR